MAAGLWQMVQDEIQRPQSQVVPARAGYVSDGLRHKTRCLAGVVFHLMPVPSCVVKQNAVASLHALVGSVQTMPEPVQPEWSPPQNH